MPSFNQTFTGFTYGALTVSNVSVVENDTAPSAGDYDSFLSAANIANPFFFGPYVLPSAPGYIGFQFASFTGGVIADANTNSVVQQALSFNYTVSVAPGSVILGYSSLIVQNALFQDTAPGGSPQSQVKLNASEVLTDTSGDPATTVSWSAAAGSQAGWFATPASTFNVALTLTAEIDENGDPNATQDIATFSNIQQGFVNGSITIDKQVSVDGGLTWQDVGNGTITPNEDIMVGCTVDYRTVISNMSSAGITLTNAQIGDVGGGSVTGFTVGGNGTFTLAAGASVTSDVGSTVALAGTYVDTATVTGTVTDNNGHSATVTASDSAEYIGIAGSVVLDKQVSVNGGTSWQDVGVGVLQDPSTSVGSTVEYRVLVTNNGSVGITGASVIDQTGTTALPGFTFGGLTTTTIAIGQTVTSDIDSTTAVVGYNLDTATVTGTVTLGNMSCTVTANDTADYQGVVTNTPTGTVSIDKQVFMCGTWQDVGSGVLNDPNFLLGAAVDFRVIVTNTGTSTLSNLSVGDANGGTITGFVFGTNDVATVATLAAGTSITSDIAATPAILGHQLDTATVTGTVGLSGTITVTASDTADYTGISGSVTIDKQVSVNGGSTWQDVGNDVLQDPTANVGSTVEYRVLVTDTGGAAITGASVADASGTTTLAGFTFGGGSSITIGIGQTVTSDVISTTAAVGHNFDTATVTGTVGLGCTVTANDTADYTGVTVTPTGSVCIDKQVYMCGTWFDVGKVLNDPNFLLGAAVDFRVIVSNTGTSTLSNLSVGDANGGTITGFVFGTNDVATVATLAAGTSITSDIAATPAILGHQLDTATVTGTVGLSGTITVTASDTADYTGISGSVTIDKQVSVNGGSTWQDVGNDVLQDPTANVGSTVEYRVLVTDTGGAAITGASVADASGTTTLAGFTFGGSSSITIGVGQTVTSDINSTAAAVGHNFDTATVTGTVGVGCTVTASDTADYTGVTVTPTGSVTIDKQVYMCGTWLDVGKVLNDPTFSVCGAVDFRVIVTNTGGTTLSNLSVGDVNGGDITGFVFGTNDIATVATLAIGQSITSDIAVTPAILGHQLDTATVTGTVGLSGTTTVTASDTADYTGVKGSITIDKQVSTNGSCWYDVGSGVLQDPTTSIGSSVYYRVIVTDTGTSTIKGITVTDVGNGAPTFSFGSGCGSNNVTLCPGQSITSNVACTPALAGYNTDVATVTGTITIGGGCGGGSTTTVSACDVADYTGTLCPGALSVFILNDCNGDGIGDNGEGGLAGVTVTLLTGTGGATGQSATTNSAGIVTFGNLIPGNYEVSVTTPQGDVVTKANSIGTPIAVTSGNTAWASEALYSPGMKGALSVFVLNDKNGNGIGDNGEGGLSGVTVTLLTGTGGATGQSATTNSAGIVTFGNLTPGNYEVSVTTPKGDVVTKANSINTPIAVTACNTAWASEALYSPPPNLCGQYGQPKEIEFCYKPCDTVSQSCLQQGLGSCSGHDAYSSCFVEISNNANPFANGAKIYFEGNCSSGQNIYASCNNVSGGCFDNTTYVSVFSCQQAFQQHQSPSQECTYVTGGSQANCNLGDQVGCVTVVGWVGTNGQHCV